MTRSRFWGNSVLLLALLLCQSVAADEPLNQVVMYTAAWCGPCQTFRREVIPHLVNAGWRVGPGRYDSETGDVNHLRLIESNDLPLPRFEVYRDGQRVDEWVGYMPKERFITRVRASFPVKQEQPEPSVEPARWNYEERTILK